MKNKPMIVATGRAVVVRPAVAKVQAKTAAVHDQPLLTALVGGAVRCLTGGRG